MVAMMKTFECYPMELKMGDVVIAPAAEVNHEKCPVGKTTPGVLGGWMCPCECHRSIKDENA